jgi:hypothetical protein
VGYVGLQQLDRAAWSIGTLDIEAEAQASVTAGLAGFGGDYTRVRTDCWLVGRGATGDLLAAYFGDGDQTLDYRTFQERPRRVVPFPKGLKVVAGDAHATRAQSLDVVYWDCEDGGSDESRARPSDCGNGYVSASVIFPECWDGRRLDSRDHGSHLRYPIDPDDDDRDSCPKSHPVPLPRMNFSIEWPVHDGTKVTIGSGSPITLHGDFFNAWRQRALRRLTVRCLVGGRDCGVVSTPDRVPGSIPLRRRP